MRKKRFFPFKHVLMMTFSSDAAWRAANATHDSDASTAKRRFVAQEELECRHC